MISVERLTVDFGQGPILDSLNFSVAPGEISAIMGLSGGGKSTLLRCLSGLIVPQAGTITICDRQMPQDLPEIRSSMGMVFQTSALFDSLSVYQNVAFAIRRRGTPQQKEQLSQTIHQALNVVGLDPEEDGVKMPSELSGGMKKRVGMARAIVLEPKIMLYDEPTTGLDPISTEVIDGLISKINNEAKTTTVLVSHDVASCCRTADRIWFLENGTFTFCGSPSEFLNSKTPAIQNMLRSVRF